MSNNENARNIFGIVLCGLIVLFLATVIPYRIISAEGLIPPIQVNTVRFVGLVLILLGIIGYMLCFRNFMVDAQGTPLPEEFNSI